MIIFAIWVAEHAAPTASKPAFRSEVFLNQMPMVSAKGVFCVLTALDQFDLVGISAVARRANRSPARHMLIAAGPTTLDSPQSEAIATLCRTEHLGGAIGLTAEFDEGRGARRTGQRDLGAHGVLAGARAERPAAFLVALQLVALAVVRRATPITRHICAGAALGPRSLSGAPNLGYRAISHFRSSYGRSG